MKFIVLLLIVTFLVAPMTVKAEGEQLQATDTKIKYIGRWVENGKGYMQGSFECMAEIRFTGTGVQTLTGSFGRVHISIDGGEYVEKNLNTKTLAKNLDEGEHSIRIYAYAQQALPVISGFKIIGEGTFLAPEKRPTIEFIGDSILEGYTVDPTKNSVANSYGHLVADMLGFDRNIVAFGGITMTPNYGNPDTQGMVKRYFMQREYHPDKPISETWDTSKFIPDHIVINLGTNDSRAQAGEFKGSYITFLGSLRKAYPDTKIYIMTPFNGRKNAEILEVYNVVKGADIFLIDSYKWGISGGSDNLHPTVEGHKQAAELLTKEIKAILEGLNKPTEAPEGTPVGTPEGTPVPDGKSNNTATYAIIGAGAVALGAGTAAVVATAKKKKEKKD